MAFQDLTGQERKHTDILPKGLDLIVPLKSVELFVRVRPCLAPLIFDLHIDICKTSSFPILIEKKTFKSLSIYPIKKLTRTMLWLMVNPAFPFFQTFYKPLTICLLK
jgi:hypothetical protein